VTTSDPTGFPQGQIVARNVRRLLDSKGMREEDLARNAGSTLDLVQEILSGRSGPLQLSDLEAFAEALGVDPNDLLRRNPQDA
jgi:DNA-binding Xre family transcriptional regulator